MTEARRPEARPVFDWQCQSD